MSETELALPSRTDTRRYDLDALRAAAMLLGIALHTALSFMPMFWPVQDTQQSEWYGVFFSAVHGFRMPLFFVLSGFFTAMLWRRRGLKSTLWQRITRVLLPCLLGLVTIVPAVNWIADVAIASSLDKAEAAAESQPDNGTTPELIAEPDQQKATNIWEAAKFGELKSVTSFLDESAEHLNSPDAEAGLTPLSWASVLGHADVVDLLLDHGAQVDTRNRDQGTALHMAAFLGRVDVAGRLLDSKANSQLKNVYGDTPEKSAQADWKITRFFAGLLGADVEESQVQQGRKEIIELIQASRVDNEEVIPEAAEETEQVVEVTSTWFQQMTQKAVFHHVWFLWFLCWLVAGFTIYATVVRLAGWKGLPTWLMLTPLCYVWLIPLTTYVQSMMGAQMDVFGPDTSAGWLPMPHVLLYYSVFFGFGALYYDTQDDEGRLGRYWWLTLPFAILVVFPIGLEFTYGGFGFAGSVPDQWHAWVSDLSQAAYAWLMTFGCIGLFRSVLSRKRAWVRYMSDSSYWLYIAHVPLVIGLQWLVRDWQIPALVKFTLVCIVVTAFLLFTYQTCVRYTLLGRMLNGPRKRSGSSSAS